MARIQRVVECVWAGEFRYEGFGEVEYLSVEVDLHASPNGDLGFDARYAGGTLYRLDRDGCEYSTPQRGGHEYQGPVCRLPGSVAEALRPWRENYSLVREY